jgi:threonylcarbamoyladenosine tRNA methylthiotransferase CDKAL1
LAIPMKALVEAYGCTLNRGEAEEFSDMMLAMGHAIVEDPKDADVLAIFTCGVIETTERHMLKRISELAAVPDKRLLVCGCMPDICPDKILRIAPDAELVGTAEHLDYLQGIRKGRERDVPSPRTVAMLPIATGCTGACSYCVTKVARGRLRSRPPAELAARLETLVGLGAAEIRICAQDTAAYGKDIGLGLADLIERLGSVEGDFMMRIGMMNPANVLQNPGEIIRAFANPKVFRFLHLPVQSGSDRMLDAMNRRHRAADFESLVSEFRSRFPGLSLSTDIITGFPGETDEDFDLSAGLVNRVRPDIVNITRFSSRPGTEAHAMKGKVPSRISKDRSRVLTDMRFRMTAENYAALEGKEMRALATERRVKGTTFLRTQDYKPVVVEGRIDLGCWYDILVTGHERTHLTGELV